MDIMEEVFKVKIDHQRLETLKPVKEAVEALKLPVVRFRKLNGIPYCHRRSHQYS
jgi:hypothetical protein